MSQYGMAAALLSQFALQVYAAAMFPRPQSKANHLSRSDCNSRSGGVSMNGRTPEWGASLMRKVDCGRRGAALEFTTPGVPVTPLQRIATWGKTQMVALRRCFQAAGGVPRLYFSGTSGDEPPKAPPQLTTLEL